MHRVPLLGIITLVAFAAAVPPAYARFSLGFEVVEGFEVVGGVAPEDLRGVPVPPDTVIARYSPRCDGGCPSEGPISLQVTRGGVGVGSADGRSDQVRPLEQQAKVEPSGGLRIGDVAHLYQGGQERVTLAYDGRPSVDGGQCGFVGKKTVTGSYEPGDGASLPVVNATDGGGGSVSVNGGRFSAQFNDAIKRFEELAVITRYSAYADVARPGELVALFGNLRVRCAAPPPVLALSMSSLVFQAAGSGPAFTARVGTKVTFTLSEPGSVKFTVQRKTRGRRVAGRCRPQTTANRTKPACTRWVNVRGSFTVPGPNSGPKSTNKFTFRGRIGGKKLKPASYRLNGRATDKAGNKSALKQTSFRIVK